MLITQRSFVYYFLRKKPVLVVTYKVNEARWFRMHTGIWSHIYISLDWTNERTSETRAHTHAHHYIASYVILFENFEYHLHIFDIQTRICQNSRWLNIHHGLWLVTNRAKMYVCDHKTEATDNKSTRKSILKGIHF